MSTKLTFCQFWKPYIILGQILCLTRLPLSGSTSTRLKRQRIAMNIYQTVLTVSITAFTCYTVISGVPIILHLHRRSSHGGFFYFYIDTFGIFMIYITLLVVLYETLLTQKSKRKLHEQLKKVDSMIRNHLKQEIDYRRLRLSDMKNSVLKFMVMTVFSQCVQTIFSMPMFLLTDYKQFSMLVFIASMMTRLRIFQVIIFVGFLTENLHQINLALVAHAKQLAEIRQRMQIRPHRTYTIGDELIHCRQIYAEVNVFL